MPGNLSGYAYSRAPTVFTSLLHGSVVSPAKLRALWPYLTQNGLQQRKAMSHLEVLAAGEIIINSINFAALSPAKLVANAAEVPAGAVGGNATARLRPAGSFMWPGRSPTSPGSNCARGDDGAAPLPPLPRRARRHVAHAPCAHRAR